MEHTDKTNSCTFTAACNNDPCHTLVAKYMENLPALVNSMCYSSLVGYDTCRRARIKHRFIGTYCLQLPHGFKASDCQASSWTTLKSEAASSSQRSGDADRSTWPYTAESAALWLKSWVLHT